MQQAQKPVTISRRRFERFPFQAPITLYSTSEMWTTSILDVSLKGVLISRPESFTGERGKRFRVTLQLPGNVFVSMGVSIAHMSEAWLGCQIERLDLDSFIHLRRLVELNLGSTELLFHELEQLGTTELI